MPRSTPPAITSPRARMQPVRPDPSAFVNPWTFGCLIRSLAWLRQTHGALPLPSPEGDPRQGVPLEALFVPPRLGPVPSLGPVPAEGSSDLLDVLENSLHVAILAEPGSGRTTLVSWLVHALTDPSRNPVTDRLGLLVPIVIPLRALELDPSVRTLDALLARLEGLPFWTAGIEEVLPELLSLGQALFVVDDLDSIDDPELQDALKEAILDGVWRAPSCSWLITAEPGSEDVLPPLDSLRDPDDLPASLSALPLGPEPELSVWYLQPFGEVQVRAFTQRWQALASPAEEAGPRAEALFAAIAGDSAARRLAASPAMLALLCVVASARGGLPTDRAELHDWLVAGWLTVLNNVPDAHLVPVAARQAWVEAMARAAEAERAASWQAWIRAGAPPSLEARVRTPPISYEQATYLLRSAQVALGLPDPGAEVAARFVFGASHRPGVLVARGGGLGFVRADQQRFLAAVQVAADLVIEADGRADGERLAQAALETVKNWSRTATSDQDLRELFTVLGTREGLTERVLHQLLGRRRSRTLTELNDLGPLAAALADGSAGVPISARAREAAEHLTDEAVARWARERGRVPRWARNIEPLRGEPDLPGLDLSGNGVLRDISPLAGMKLLSRIDLRDCMGVGRIDALGELPSLRWADLRGCTQVKELAPLRSSHELRWLDLSGTRVVDLEALAGLDSLHALVLSGCTGITDLGPLCAIRSLRALVLSGCTGVFDLSPLRRLPSGGTVWVQGSGVRLVPASLRWTVLGL